MAICPILCKRYAISDDSILIVKIFRVALIAVRRRQMMQISLRG